MNHISVLSDELIVDITEKMFRGFEASVVVVKACGCVCATRLAIKWLSTPRGKVRLGQRFSRGPGCSKHHSWRMAKNLLLAGDGFKLEEFPLL